jgi:hypothetical protein
MKPTCPEHSNHPLPGQTTIDWVHQNQAYWAHQYKYQDKECELIYKTPEEELPLLIGQFTTAKAKEYFLKKMNGEFKRCQTLSKRPS